jgi:hypothetical protein
MEVNGQLHDPTALPPEEKVPDTHWMRRWVGPTAGLDALRKRKVTKFILHLNYSFEVWLISEK